ncbi:MAG: lipoyl domain-containing protein, partial [Baekduiaceae bacterium]
MIEVTMPRLSDSMEEGTILQGLGADGDPVSRGDELAEIETDKATMTYEADADGLVHHVAREGDTLAVGTPIAVLLAARDRDTEILEGLLCCLVASRCLCDFDLQFPHRPFKSFSAG